MLRSSCHRIIHIWFNGSVSTWSTEVYYRHCKAMGLLAYFSVFGLRLSLTLFELKARNPSGAAGSRLLSCVCYPASPALAEQNAPLFVTV